MHPTTTHAAFARLFTEGPTFALHQRAERPETPAMPLDAFHDFLLVSARPDLLPDALPADDYVRTEGIC